MAPPKASPPKDISIQTRRKMLKKSAVRIHEQAQDWLAETPSIETVAKVSEAVSQLRDILSQYQEAAYLEIGTLDKLNKPSDAIDEEENDILTEVEKIRTTVMNTIGKLESVKVSLADQTARASLVASNISFAGNQSIVNPSVVPVVDRVKIPKFDGNVREFMNWKNLFEELVHHNASFNNNQKMYYLKGSMEKDAALLLRDFELNADSYMEAWSYLLSRFENRRSIIRAHFNDLIGLKVIDGEAGIRGLLDKVNSIVRGLRVCGEKVDEMSSIICHIVASRLDVATRRDWEHSVVEVNRYPSYTRLETFLSSRSFSYEDAVPVKCDTNSPSTAAAKSSDRFVKKSSMVVTSSSECVLCSDTHRLINCRDFIAKNSHDRYTVVKQARLCLKCLCAGHYTSDCESQGCSKCQKAHHDLLHHDFSLSKKIDSSSDGNGAQSASKASLSAISSVDAAVILPTAVVRVKVGARYAMARVLLDNCSQPNLISESFVKRHKLRLDRSDAVPIDSIGNFTRSDRVATVNLTSRFEVNEFVFEADVVPRIPYTIPSSFVARMQAKFPDLKLAEHFIHRTNVDLVIGGRLFHRLVRDDRRFVGELCAQGSAFGWVVAGPDDLRSGKLASACSFVTSYGIQDRLRDFWKIEEATRIVESVPEHNQCIQHFESNVVRQPDGKFCLRLPFKVDRSKIGQSRDRALAALYRVERQLDPDTRRLYVEFMEEYESLGHMVKIESHLPEPSSVYYIPHRAVLKPTSSTTKLRVVFNASAKSSSNISLNDALMVGPALQPDLFDTLIRFRKHRIAFCADISKMYRCVNIAREDQDMQRILWRESPDQPVSAYRLTTITYGTAPASFLATKCLATLADDISNQHPETARTIRSDFYMDDLLTGAHDLSAALDLQRSVHSTLMGAQLPLRKYMSNSLELLDTLEPSLVEKLQPLQFGDGGSIGILGLQWDPVLDCFRLSTNLRDLDRVDRLTKRLMLSEIARIYDPLGFVSPVTIRAKIILQDLWREQKGWDEPVSEVVSTKFRDYYRELSQLSSFSVPRLYSSLSMYVHLQIVGFCDASESAYCAVLYLRAVSELGEISTSLVCSKTRVAPIKELTIPRLELQAALLLAELSNRIALELKVDSRNVYYFSDSTVTLCWLDGSPDRWTIFVRNRVLKIHELCANSWCYVNTKENPADLGTRGISVSRLLDCHLWKSGPPFLKDPDPFIRDFSRDIEFTPETRVEKCSLATVRIEDCIFEILHKFSCLDKLVNVISYVLRVNPKRRVDTCQRVLSAAERECALFTVIRVLQRHSFSTEVALLDSGSQVGKNSALQKLLPFIDKVGLIRVGGRLRNSSFSYAKKHPIVLSARWKIVELLVRHVHSRYFHASRSFIMNLLHGQYWILGSLTNVIKRVVNSCVVCIRFKAQPMEQIMGQLPATRVTVARPFSYIGVDFAGPFSSKCVDHRTTKFGKIYIALFVCFVTRGIHIEIVKSLSTEDFLASLVRFCSRRGMPTIIHSDNGTNFVGANNLIIAGNPQILNHAAREKFEWKFIPPRAPHQGGIWEAAVRSAKFHLIRVTHGTTLNYEEYATLFAKIEMVLNSRPLCYKSLPDRTGGVLTPAHFWMGSSLLSPDEFTDRNSPDMNLPLTRRYELVSDQVNSFWNQWSRDYLNQLQSRSKWRSIKSNVRVHDVVLLRDDLAPPCVWKLAVVIAVYPDQEGHVRMVDVRSSGVVKRRAVTSLVMLVPEEGSSASGVCCG